MKTTMCEAMLINEESSRDVSQNQLMAVSFETSSALSWRLKTRDKEENDSE